MKLRFGRCALVLSLAAAVSLICLNGLGSTPQVPGQQDYPQSPSRSQDDGVRLPNGKLQRDEILKAEHEQNLKDAAQLVELSEQLKEDLEKNDAYVLSMSTLKKTDDIEKLVKKIRSRMRRN
ncbi:MAG TPA: hypothetical protein VMH81_13095 [Bryobacteraceae bacterium]|nr:hypothetical protein [Bryobacteraceae bacterium]